MLTAATKTFLTAATIATALAAAAPQAEAAPERVRTGTLSCSVSAGVAVVVGERRLYCTFRGSRGGREHYAGTLTKVGLNLAVTGKGVLGWAVFETAGRHGSLAGQYAGATGEASLGAGIGANALFGGGNSNNVALQPFSAQAQTGVGFTLGGASLTLTRLRR